VVVVVVAALGDLFFLSPGGADGVDLDEVEVRWWYVVRFPLLTSCTIASPISS